METIISRVGWCPDCYKAQRPRTDNFFVVIGSKGYHIKQARHIGNTGFTPQIYKVIKIEGNNVTSRKTCGMNDCGSEVYWVQSKGIYQFRLDKGTTEIMTLDNWKALVAYKRDENYEI